MGMSNNYTAEDYKFWLEYMATEYPNRPSHQYWNSAEVRKRMIRKN
jgi:hypothetical protein